jgi:hypothetical protein
MKNYFVIVAIATFFFTNSSAQVGINSVSTISNLVIGGSTVTQTVRSHGNSVNTVLPNTNYETNYLNTNNIRINSFNYSGKTYVKFSNFDTIIFRRAANTWINSNGNKQNIFVQGINVNNVTHSLPYPTGFPTATGHAYMQKILKDGYINRGTDNLFNNDSTSDITYNNIERADFVIRGGCSTPLVSSAGFLITERGGNDAFKIAAILGVDANGNPNSFWPVRSVASNSYGSTILTLQSHVLRKDISDNALRPFSTVSSQAIKSVFVRYSDLGIAPNQLVYGYSLMATDVTATTSAQVRSFTNSTYFPRNTNATAGGIDLASAPGVYHTDFVLAGHYLDLAVQNRNCQNMIQWNDNEYESVENYELQRSTDGEHFQTVQTFSQINHASNSATDNSSGNSYFRLKVKQLNGEEYFSKIVYAESNCNNTVVSLYPNPVSDVLNLSFSGISGSIQVSLFTLTGRKLNSWKVGENSRQFKADLSGLSSGQYYVSIQTMTGYSKTLPVIKF